MSGDNADDTEVYVLSRADVVAAFELWAAAYPLEGETVPQTIERLRCTEAEAYAETFLAFVLELANQPDVELP